MTPLKGDQAETRTVAGVSLGPHVEGVAMPHPDISDQRGAQHGCRKRFSTRMPTFDRKLRRRMVRYSRRWLKKNLKPFSPTHEFDFEKWLLETNYTDARKKELREVWNGSLNLLDNRNFRAKCFIKDEYYPEYKYPRAINSREDAFKTFFGPVVKEIESELYQLPAFIKHVPVAERPEYIRDKLYRQGARYFGTDFTSFEASFSQRLMIELEFELYRHMLSAHPIWEYVREVTLKYKAGLNTLLFKKFICKILATRLSGEMDTSEANGYSNLIVNSFILEELIRSKWFDGVVEGDDGLFAFIGGSWPTSQMYKDLGFNIKIAKFDNLFEASFCGIIFDEATLTNIACPYKNLAKFGWTTHHYAKASPVTHLKLLRSKGLSLLAQYPGCPVLQALGEYAVRMTKHINMGDFVDQSDGWWEREQRRVNSVKAPVLVPVEMTTRLLMEKCFGMPVSEQINIERLLASKKDLSPIKIDTNSFPDLWVRHFYTYGVNQSAVDGFQMATRRQINAGFEWKQVFEPGTNFSFSWVQVGFVDHKGMRYYDSILKRDSGGLFFPPYKLA
jgi:hypothetical protein